mmetsp:Transcript_19500/g.56711  ORF Transcript_19500/g.56711 Transcript_19500/m.56711 type:complete len:439 (-) Transcript_19500:72-1388(-)
MADAATTMLFGRWQEFRMARLAAVVVGALSVAPALGQMMMLPPGTRRAPSPRPSGCAAQGSGNSSTTYVYRMASLPPNVEYPAHCSDLGGVRVRFNDPCAWAHGAAQLTVAHFDGMCKGATRVIHWHDGADEWGYVHRGKLQTYVTSPDGLPWPNSNNVLTRHGVWYFPRGWLHGLTCLTPESEGGCVFSIVFSGPVSVPIDNHNLDTTLAQAPDHVAAAAMSVSVDVLRRMRPTFAGSAGPVNATPSSSPLVTMLAKGLCSPECPTLQETRAAPAAVEALAAEKTVEMPGGVLLHQIRTDQFPFSATMSQERTELPPGGLRPIVWVANADGLLVVTSGVITLSVQGGLAGSSNPAEAHEAFTAHDLRPGDVAYLPVGRAYWFQESTGKASASAITVFNVGEWQSVELADSLALLPAWAVSSNLHQARHEPLEHVYMM